MTEFLQSISLFPLMLTFGTYQVGVWCQKKTRSPLCNPLLIATILSIAVLLLTKFDLAIYQSSSAWITWLLTPATVSLAVPLYTQLKVFKGELKAILIGIAAGTVASLGFVGVLCVLMGLDRTLTVSLLPKSITTAIGLVLSEQNGGIPGLFPQGFVQGAEFFVSAEPPVFLQTPQQAPHDAAQGSGEIILPAGFGDARGSSEGG